MDQPPTVQPPEPNGWTVLPVEEDSGIERVSEERENISRQLPEWGGYFSEASKAYMKGEPTAFTHHIYTLYHVI